MNVTNATVPVHELKNRHGLDRVRSRGTPLFHLQLLLGCTALNCKRLADHVPEAANGVAAAPPIAASDLRAATAAAYGADRPIPNPTGSAIRHPPSAWSDIVCFN